MPVKNCPKCGEELPLSVNFCRACGESVEPVAAAAGDTEPINPYSSPAPMQVVTKPRDASSYELASTGQRFGNLIVDNIVTFVLSNVMGFVMGISVGLYFAANNWELTQSHLDTLELAAMFAGFFLGILYFVTAESLGHRTIGKLITGTKVVDKTGGPPSFGQVLGRTAARFIPFEAFSFLGADAVGWHDSLSGTRVVKTR